MASKSFTAIKYTVAGGIIVYVVSAFAGPASTANFTTTSIRGTGWGIGVLFGSAPEAGVGFDEGVSAAKVAVNP